MYQIKYTQNKEFNEYVLEIYNSKKSSYTKIQLNQGARILELKTGNHHIIKDMKPLAYSKTYASSILFPFANRIKDGIYCMSSNKFELFGSKFKRVLLQI